jgi:hypothetical protein
MTTVQTVLLLLVGCAFASSFSFVVLYAWLTRGAWRKSATGRNVMLLMSVIVAAMAQILAVRWVGMYPGRDEVSGALYVAVTYASVRRIVLMLRAQAGSADGRSLPPRAPDLVP